MKKLSALLLAIICVFAIAGCRKVENESVPYDLSQSGVSSKGEKLITYDRARAFNSEYQRLVEKYGTADFDGDKLKGVAVVRLIDFLGNGNYTMYVAYADGTTPYVNKQEVFGFDNGMSKLLELNDSSVAIDITSKASADAEAPSIWLYTDVSGRGYIVTGEDMSKSADYNTFVGLKNGEKVYSFCCEFTKTDNETLGGTYEKINLAGITEEDAENIFSENQKVVDSMEAQSKKDSVKN